MGACGGLLQVLLPHRMTRHSCKDGESPYDNPSPLNLSSFPLSLHREHVDEGGLGVSFPSRAAAGGRVRMSRRQLLNDPEGKHRATRDENPFDERCSETGLNHAFGDWKRPWTRIDAGRTKTKPAVLQASSRNQLALCSHQDDECIDGGVP